MKVPGVRGVLGVKPSPAAGQHAGAQRFPHTQCFPMGKKPEANSVIRVF